MQNFIYYLCVSDRHNLWLDYFNQQYLLAESWLWIVVHIIRTLHTVCSESLEQH